MTSVLFGLSCYNLPHFTKTWGISAILCTHWALNANVAGNLIHQNEPRNRAAEINLGLPVALHYFIMVPWCCSLSTSSPSRWQKLRAVALRHVDSSDVYFCLLLWRKKSNMVMPNCKNSTDRCNGKITMTRVHVFFLIWEHEVHHFLFIRVHRS